MNLAMPLRLASFVLLLIACLGSGKASAAGRAQTAQPGEYIISLAGYANALCSDGTPGVYYFRKSQSGSTSWLFYLEGGEHCSDNGSCQHLFNTTPKKTTSTGWGKSHPEGILSTDAVVNPTFHDANIVEVHTCSGDDFSGARLATVPFQPDNAEAGGWSFEGRAIALAALQDLSARNDLTGFSAATSFLLSGSSGGGLGAVYLANDVFPCLRSGVRRLLAVDAGFSLQMGRFDTTISPTYTNQDNPYADVLETAIPLWNGHGDTPCARTAVTLSDQITCYNTAFLLSSGAIRVGTFIAQSTIDTVQLDKHGWRSTVTQDQPHVTYETEFSQAMVRALGGTLSRTNIFAPQRLTHTMFAVDSTFGYAESFATGPISPSFALSTWFNAPGMGRAVYGQGAGLPLP